MHEAGVEYWLQYGLSPSKKSVVYVDTNTDDGTYAIYGTLKYVMEDKVLRKNYKCEPNATMESYTRCTFNEIEYHKCSPAINRVGYSFNETNICKNLTELNDKHNLITKQLKYTLYNQSSPSSCIKPCKTASFEVSLQKKDGNGKLLGNSKIKELATPGRFLLNFKYDDFVIDNRKEYLVMNEDGLISAVGGFLGLFLGSSCVSVIEWIGQLLKKCTK